MKCGLYKEYCVCELEDSKVETTKEEKVEITREWPQKKYPCPHCPNKYSSKLHLSNHIKKYHPEKKKEEMPSKKNKLPSIKKLKKQKGLRVEVLNQLDFDKATDIKTIAKKIGNSRDIVGKVLQKLENEKLAYHRIRWWYLEEHKTKKQIEKNGKDSFSPKKEDTPLSDLTTEKELKCPECNSNNIIKHGKRYNQNNIKQIYLCKDCNNKFILGKYKGKKTPEEIISFALGLKGKETYRKIAKEIKKKFNYDVAFQTIIKWEEEQPKEIREWSPSHRKKFKEAIEARKEFKQKLTEKICINCKKSYKPKSVRQLRCEDCRKEKSKATKRKKVSASDIRKKTGRPPLNNEKVKKQILELMSTEDSVTSELIKRFLGYSRHNISKILLELEKEGKIYSPERKLNGGKLWYLKQEDVKMQEETEEQQKEFSIVEVEWFDAQSSTESLYLEEIKEKLKPIHSKSVGYLVHETVDYIVLGFTNFGDELIKHHQVIPKGMIKKMRYIK